ncbi:hypothetical protein [Brevundimonas sp.]|uniref:hypothetical protein n=1 Tax=Brevundimonas sp. TaxID=1871086 RepID=UPI002AB99C55|nr:hypothetical protein [Brevundimonas sp.]MDZ4364407.1 hypothetical protein [Brevundimonas sp.]
MTDLTSENRSFDAVEMTTQRLSVAMPGGDDGFYADRTPATAKGEGRAAFGNLSRNLTTQSQVQQR